MSTEPKPLLDDCFLHDKHRLRHHDAIDILKSRLNPVVKKNTVSLQDANNKILAQSITAPQDVPGNDNSAVDGYAFSSAQFDDVHGEFEIAARIAAGGDAGVIIPKSSAARIFTGAPVPQGVDTIAMQEDCQLNTRNGSQFVTIPPGLKRGANLRKAGEDVTKGEEILKTGTRLTPPDIAAIASFGFETIEVFTNLKIALASTGDEIIRPGTPQKPGQVYDANHFMIASLLQNLPVEITDLGILEDDKKAVTNALNKASITHDVIITSGGVSKGEEDHVMNFLDQNGKRHLWQLAIKPGRPMCFGQLDDTLFFGLPGNPVASFVCFLLYLRPALLRLGGADWTTPRSYQIPAGFDIKSKKPDRREFWRASLLVDENGRINLRKFARDGSGLISGLREADGLIEVAEEVTSVKKGDLLDFYPFSEFGI